jgi:hypothetical protein
MLVEVFVKDPSAVLDYYMDWTDLLASSDTIVTSTWVASSDTVTLSDDDILSDITVVWVEGGEAGELVDLTNHIVTAEGREDERTLRLKVRD